MKIERYRFQNGKWSSPPSPAPSGSLVFAFGCRRIADTSEAWEGLDTIARNGTLIGCSTAGEIFDAEVEEESVVVAALTFAHAEHRVASAKVEGPVASFLAGQSIAAELQREDLRAMVVFGDGVHVNGSELLRGLSAELSGEVVIAGGLSGDGDRFESTWTLLNDQRNQKEVVACGFYGESLHVRSVSGTGWDIFGPSRRVTRAEGNVLYELDGRPALELYDRYLGDLSAALPAAGLLFPLEIRKERVIRTIRGIDREAGSVTFAGDIPPGREVRLMKANFDRLVQGAEDAARELRSLADRPTFTLAISCVGRKLVLRERSEEEVEATLEMLPSGSSQIGFFSYGQLGPGEDGRCRLFNQSITLLALQEQ